MAVLTITDANVKPGAQASIEYRGLAAGAVRRGRPVYIDANDQIQECANSSEALAEAVGIALNQADDGQPVAYVKSGEEFEPGATLVFPETYYVGDSAGDIIPAADLGSGDYVTPLFTAKSTSKAILCIKPTAAAIA